MAEDVLKTADKPSPRETEYRTDELPYPEETALLPVWPTVGMAFKVGRNQTFKLIAAGKFPVKVWEHGNRFYARTADVRRELGLVVNRPTDIPA
jgi:hypothetical protein